jgi:hypothetical protein
VSKQIALAIKQRSAKRRMMPSYFADMKVYLLLFVSRPSAMMANGLV